MEESVNYNENLEKDFVNLVQQYPSIKIIKNTKGYNFEFKILSNNIEEMDKVHKLIVDKIKDWEKTNTK